MASVTAAQRVRPFMGRESELRALSDLLRGGDETRVACLHGIAGVGKSGLVRAFLDRVGRNDSTALLLDCRTVEPTERGFLAAAGGFDDVEAFVRHVRGRAPPVVIALDHYEVFRLMDTWLRQVLVPALPAGTSLLLAGRERPLGAWFSLEGFRTLPLGPLEDADALSRPRAPRDPRGRRRPAEPDRARASAGADARLGRRLRAPRAADRGRRHDPRGRGAHAALPRGRGGPARAPGARGGLARAAGHRAAAGGHDRGRRRRGAPAPARAAVRRRRPRRPHRPRVGPGRRRGLPARHEPDALPPRPPRRVA